MQIGDVGRILLGIPLAVLLDQVVEVAGDRRCGLLPFRGDQQFLRLAGMQCERDPHIAEDR